MATEVIEAGARPERGEELSPRERRALAAICDTFAPGDGDALAATELGVPEAIVAGLTSARKGDRRQLRWLLRSWDNPLLAALAGAGLRAFSTLDPPGRERVLRSWCDSRLSQRRAAFQALRKAALVSYYTLAPEEGANPSWQMLEYPGPPGFPADPPPKRLIPLSVTADVELCCDVCVVGSGAGGGTAAAVLAAAGLDVVVVEAGGYYDDADFDGDEHRGYRRLYLNGGALSTHDQSVGLLSGACLGGGTTVNYTTSFPTPSEVREEWAEHGLPATSQQFRCSTEAVWSRLGVNEDESGAWPRDVAMIRGLRALGWHVGVMPRNVRGCDAGTCGRCGHGCPRGAKQSAVKTWLADAFDEGARILVDTRVERVLVERDRVRGVEARTVDGHRVHVRSRAVVAACGALHTPALLRRSGLTNPNIGRHLRLHPVTGVCGVFEEPIRPWEGMLASHYSDEHHDLDGDGYGVKYEVGGVNPSLLAFSTPWRSAAQHAELMRSFVRCAPVVVFLRDRDGGEVRVDREGEPVVHYRLSPHDRRHLRRGVEGAAQILEASGARRIFSSHAGLVAYEPGRGRREQFLRDGDACGWGAGQLVLASVHSMGSARMGSSSRSSVCNPEGQTWEVEGLFVCDGATFPTASGVNPMISIEAVAHMNAAALATRLG